MYKLSLEIVSCRFQLIFRGKFEYFDREDFYEVSKFLRVLRPESSFDIFFKIVMTAFLSKDIGAAFQNRPNFHTFAVFLQLSI